MTLARDSGVSKSFLYLVLSKSFSTLPELFVDVLEQSTGDTEDNGWLALVQ